MKKLYYFIPAVILLAVSCEKEENLPAFEENEPVSKVEMVTETVSGSRGTSTKALISDADASFSWTEGDNVAVHISNGKYVYTSDEGASGATITDIVHTDDASFTVVYEAGYERDAFALYPSTIVARDAENYGQEGHTLDVTLPGSYTLAQVTGETSPCPMISTDVAGAGWNFFQLCGLLRLIVNNIPPSTKRLEVDFDGKKVWGDFSIDNPTPGSSSIATSTDADYDVITITNSGETLYSGWANGKAFNIPLPVGTYTNITVTAYDALSGGNATLVTTLPFEFTSTNVRGAKRTASFPVFSVSSTKRVIFAPGNLQATTTDLGKNWVWHFAEHQYDYIGKATANDKVNGDGTVLANGTVDLFQKSTTAYSTYGISNSGDYNKLYKGTFKDWGNIDIDGKGTNYWHTLTIAASGSNSEWGYILFSRNTGVKINETNNARYTLARINTDSNPVNGLIFIPDAFVGGAFTGVTWGTINAASAWTTECTTTGWASLEAAGCVFLPITGRRANSKGVFYDLDKGYYLGNINKCAAAINFKTNGVSGSTTISYAGCAVRLVHEVK